ALPYIDNLVNLVVSQVPLSGLAMAEVLRVLAPESVAYISDGGGGWAMTVKPRPADIDEWQQYLHDADNNAVAKDTVVGPPRHLQWTQSPAWSRSHMGISTIVSVVSSNGRLFSIEDRGPVENAFLPGDFRLIARDAFNGIELWQHDFTDWECITRYIKDIAVQLQRRLAAIGDTVYCTPGLSAPVQAFDAATGTVLKTYTGTDNTQEFAYHDGVLYLVIGNRMNAARYNIVKTYSGKGISLGGSDPNYSFDGCGFDGAYTPEVPDIVGPTCDIVAVDAVTGSELWRQSSIVNYVACTLAIRGSNLAYQTQSGLFCLNPADGVERWSIAKAISSLDGTEANTLILSDTVVYAQEGGSVFAYSLADANELWSAAVSQNYEKSADIFLTGGKLWTGGKGKPTSHDLSTGAPIDQFAQVKDGPMGHDRCYRNFITENYYINSKTGGADFILLSDGTELPHYWVRGTCGYGVLPCNGLMYSTPFSCQCSIEVMIQNFNAFYAEPGLTSSNDPVPVATADRRETGPAYNYIDAGYIETGWPTHRGDGQRSGSTDNYVPAMGLDVEWEFEVKTTASTPTIEDGKVFVADIDAHTVYALNASDGTELWRYVATGRVDSPPTYYKGLVMFGSRDGWVYCVKADTGELSWRFNGLPEKRMCAFSQLESPWPVEGGVLVKDGVVYFSAGRNSFVDGGIFLFGLDPQTGSVIHRYHEYGPFDGDSFPTDDGSASKSDMLLTDGTNIYMRHKAFDASLNTVASPGDHIIATCGLLDGGLQHRTYWRFATGYGSKNIVTDCGDILLLDEADRYEMRGFPV
ncbi:MAG: PQQ-binding-like beta-propeller repeat protein, partial [Planctomycetes bacterium]|nr:PQQ-binding-like beta-propeller repeat protein [Planctomycetota bacterium]